MGIGTGYEANVYALCNIPVEVAPGSSRKLVVGIKPANKTVKE